MEKPLLHPELSLGVKRGKKRFLIALLAMAFCALAFFLLELFVGYSKLPLSEAIPALFGQGRASAVRIMQRIRLPLALAGILVGGGLGLAGVLMQTSLSNPMASPGTIGVSNAAVLGANIAIILMTDNPSSGLNWYIPNIYAVSAVAFISAILSTALILGLARIKNVSPTTIILIGVGLSAGYQAITTLIQYFAVDSSLVAAVYWSFGDINRILLKDTLPLAIVVVACFVIMMLLSSRFDAFLLGEQSAKSLGVRTTLLRFAGLFLASLLTATIVSLCGIIGFVGIVAPHICRRIVGSSHRKLIPCSFLMGGILIAGSDFIASLVSKAAALPVGAVTSLIGAPFFVFLMLSKKEVEQ